MDALLENKGAFLRQIATSQQDDKPSTASRCARVLLAAWIVDMAGNNEAAATCVELASAWLNAKDTEMIAMLALAAPADPSAASAKEWRTAATEAIQPNRVAALSPQSRLVLHHALVLTYATSPPTGTAMDALSAALAVALVEVEHHEGARAVLQQKPLSPHIPYCISFEELTF